MRLRQTIGFERSLGQNTHPVKAGAPAEFTKGLQGFLLTFHTIRFLETAQAQVSDIQRILLERVPCQATQAASLTARSVRDIGFHAWTTPSGR
jgi:hypothetical protein